MNRNRFLAIAAICTLWILAFTAAMQPATAQSGAAEANTSAAPTDANGVPTVEAQMKLFTDRLDLTADQQAQIKPILQDLRDTTLNAVTDSSLSHEDRMATLHSARLKADKQIREHLTEDQKQKLDQIEHEPHPELHGNIHG